MGPLPEQSPHRELAPAGCGAPSLTPARGANGIHSSPAPEPSLSLFRGSSSPPHPSPRDTDARSGRRGSIARETGLHSEASRKRRIRGRRKGRTVGGGRHEHVSGVQRGSVDGSCCGLVREDCGLPRLQDSFPGQMPHQRAPKGLNDAKAREHGGQGCRDGSHARKGWEGWQSQSRLTRSNVPACPLATSTETQQSPERRFWASRECPAQTDLAPWLASVKVSWKYQWRPLYQGEPLGGDLLQERGGGVSRARADTGPPTPRGCRVWGLRGDSCSSL